MLVAYTTSARRAARRTSSAARTWRSGERRDAHRIGYTRSSGVESAVVTTSTTCPRSERKSATPGAWLAGPPGSGGQIPETTTTLTAAGTPRRGSAARPRLAAARSRRAMQPRTRASRRARATAAPVAPHSRAEHGDERDCDERLEAVRHDPQARTADRHRKRLRPADRELDRRGNEHDAGRRDRAVVLGPEARLARATAWRRRTPERRRA